jgi:hypothetical protein
LTIQVERLDDWDGKHAKRSYCDRDSRSLLLPSRRHLTIIPKPSLIAHVDLFFVTTCLMPSPAIVAESDSRTSYVVAQLTSSPCSAFVIL